MPPAVLHVNSGIRSKIFLLRFHTITLGFIYKTLCFIYKTLGFIYDESGQRILCLAIIFERLFILNNFYAYVFEIMFRTYDVKRIRFWFPFI